MKLLYFSVSGQQMTKNGDFSNLLRGWKKYVQCTFSFNEEWAGMAKVAEFSDLSCPDKIYPVLLQRSTCDVPDEMSEARRWQVRLIGQNGAGVRITTNKVTVRQGG